MASDGSSVRVVKIEPQAEPAPPAAADPAAAAPVAAARPTPPAAGDLAIGDTTLFPGQGTTFSFNSSEAGMAKLTVQKQVPGSG